MLGWFLVPSIPDTRMCLIKLMRNKRVVKENMKSFSSKWVNFTCVARLRRSDFQYPFIRTLRVHCLESLIRWIGQNADRKNVQVPLPYPTHLQRKTIKLNEHKKTTSCQLWWIISIHSMLNGSECETRRKWKCEKHGKIEIHGENSFSH